MILSTRRGDLDELRALFSDGHAWMRDEVTERDVAIFRRAQQRLRDVFEHGTAGRDAEAVDALNALLEAYPVQPRISGHDANDWHMHVTSRGRLGQRRIPGRRGLGPVGVAVRVRQRPVRRLRRRALRQRLPRHLVELLPAVLLGALRHPLARGRPPGPQARRDRDAAPPVAPRPR